MLKSFPGRVGDFGYQKIVKLIHPCYFVRPDEAPESLAANRASKRGYYEPYRSVRETDESYLQQVPLNAPVLIVQGRQDVIRETNTVLVARFPRARNVWIDDACHFPWFENPRAFREAVLPFYKQHVAAELKAP